MGHTAWHCYPKETEPPA